MRALSAWCALLLSLASLQASQREAITLRYEHELSYKEGAAVMGISAKAFEMHLARGLRALAAELNRIDADQGNA